MGRQTFHPIAYRPDIDGLRAVAVLGVLISHARFPFLHGGFVGVDVFFVISGYLITSIMVHEISEGRFSLARFYERRIKRIFPALYAMLALVSVVCWIFFLPVDFKEFGESLAAVSIFLSNFYFNLKSGYFDLSSELRPLLHTWSLGVEEQYYVVFPLLVFAVFRFGLGRHILWILVALWILSFGASQVWLEQDMQSVFYLPWFRAWELLTGSILAVMKAPWQRSAIAGRALSVFGLLFMLGPMAIYTEDTAFPGLAALLPVLGAAMVIGGGLGAGAGNIGARLLSLGPVRYIGNISYSLYLWHWPPLVFVRYLSPDTPSAAAIGGALAVAFALAILSYHFVEQPVRRRRPSTARVLVAGVMLCLATFPIGASARVFQGMPWRLPPQIETVSAVALDINPRRNACDSRSLPRLANGDICSIGDGDAAPTFALVGDSFADAFAPGVAAAATDMGTRGYVLTYGGCYPLLGTDQKNGVCDAFFSAVADFLRDNEKVQTVVLIARWTSAFEASRYGFNSRSDMFVTDPTHPVASVQTNRIVVEAGLTRLLSKLDGKRVFVAAFVPEQAQDVPRQAGISLLLGDTPEISLPRAVFDNRQAVTRQTLERMADTLGFQVIDVGTAMCDETQCPAMQDGLPLYVDDNHVSASTAIALRALFHDAVDARP